jgi:hypothetical protein
LNILLPSSGSESKLSKKPAEASGELNFHFPPFLAAFLLDLLFYREDGSDMFIRNYGFSPNYMLLQPVMYTFNRVCPNIGLFYSVCILLVAMQCHGHLSLPLHR